MDVGDYQNHRDAVDRGISIRLNELHLGITIWLTGLPCSGKTTISRILEKVLQEAGHRVEVLDGDEVRKHLGKGLGFSLEDRNENVRRIGYVAKLLTRNGVVTITAVVSPYRALRDEVRDLIGRQFIEVYVKCPLEELVRRDVKGMYAKALAGLIPNFTGISDPYEVPLNPDVLVETDQETAEESAGKIIAKLEELGYISREVPELVDRPASRHSPSIPGD